ncbi:NAD(P)/FAD-dependent oxidoreductase [Salinarimonas sp. NSM]|uniref:NAD(P)/FAD-dependent oxidoreductase n=1 Tax=Salinarimonas sp. NSM TaxID=3458003 RepID=UPI0040370529
MTTNRRNGEGGSAAGPSSISRRGALKALAGAAAIGALPLAGSPARAARISSRRVDVVIAGAGAAGLTAAARLSALLPNGTITILDAREAHWFQPGFTLVGSGVWAPGRTIDRNARFLPERVSWIKADVAEIDPEARRVVATTGEAVSYDVLVVATGLELAYDAIDGMSRDLIGRDGIASIYAGPEAAGASWVAMQAFVETGGEGHFGRPATEMKCAGAPLKYTLLTDDRLRGAGTRGRANLTYFAHNQGLFAVPPVAAKVAEIFAGRDVTWRPEHVLAAIEPGRKRATYRTPDGMVEAGYDFIHVVPPMRAPRPVRESGLSWQEGPLAADGWVEVHKHTMQHTRWPNVFAIGDVAGVPKGKTAASVKWQTPVACENIVSWLEERELTASYNGYTSCPLVTRVGTAMLVEFDYDNNLTPSFPFIDPLEESWVAWVIEEKALMPTYHAMLRGLA